MTVRRITSRRAFLRMSALGTLSATLIAACGPAPTSTSPAAPTTAASTGSGATPAPATSAPTTGERVKVQFANDWNTLVRLDAVKLFESTVEEKYPNIDLERLQIGAEANSGGDFRNVIITSLAANTAADIIWGWVGILVDFPDKMADLTDAMKGLDFNIDDTLHIEENVFMNGRLYALPANPQFSGWFYNKTMFDKAGVELPDETWTWDTVLEIAQKMTNAENKEYGIYAPGGSGWNTWWDWVASGGGVPINDQGKTGFGDGDGPEAFERWVDFIYKHKVSPSPADATALTSASITSPFASGKIAMMPGGLQEAGREADRIGDRFEWGFAMKPRSPHTGARGYWLSSEDFVIPEQTKARGTFEAATQAARTWFEDPVQEFIAQRLPSLPSVIKWFQSDVFLKPPPLNREIVHQSYEDMGKSPNIIFGNGYRKGWPQWVNAYRAELDRAFNGELPPREALQRAIEAGDKVLAENM